MHTDLTIWVILSREQRKNVGTTKVARSVENLSSSRYRLQTRRATVGALVGGFLFDLFGAYEVTGLNIYSMIVAVMGSVVVLLIYNTVMGRRRA